MRFLGLLYPKGRDPNALVQQQRAAGEHFPALVAQSPFKYWRPGDPIVTSGERLLIGVGASFHLGNLRLLDLIWDAITSWPVIAVNVFDIQDAETEANLSNYFPGLKSFPPFSQLPTLGIWQDGKHVQNLTGFAANQYLLKRFGINLTPQQLYDSVRPPSKEMIEG